MAFMKTESAFPNTSRTVQRSGIFREFGPDDDIPWKYIPFKHPIARLIAYGWVLFWTTSVYYGYSNIYRMLIVNGNFDYLCPEDKPECDVRETAIENVFTIAYSSEYGFSLLAGYLFDAWGPMSGLLGLTLFTAGWIFVMISSHDFETTLVGFLLIGASVNFTAFPTLVLADYFPKHAALAISFVVGCQTAATLVAVFLRQALDNIPGATFQNVILTYIFVILFPIFVIFFLTLPVKRPVRQVLPDEVEMGSPMKLSNERRPTAIGNDTPIPQGGVEESKPNYKQFVREVLTVEYLMFAFYYSISGAMFGYWQTAAKYSYGDAIADFSSDFLPTQVIWGILFGFAVKPFGTLPVSAFLATCIFLAFVGVYVNSTVVGYICACIFVVANAYTYTVKYTYAEEVFAHRNFGMLCGFFNMLSGSTSMIYILFRAYLSKDTIILISVLLIIPQGLLLSFLFWRQQKGYSDYRHLDKDHAVT